MIKNPSYYNPISKRREQLDLRVEYLKRKLKYKQHNMKTTMKSLIALFACLAIVSCGQSEKKKEEFAKKDKYCGIELTGFEVIDLKTLANSGFKGTEADQKLIKDIVNEVNDLFEDKYEIGMAFIMKDNEKAGIYIQGPDDAAVVEKVCCHLLGKDMDGRLPKERKLLYYTEAHTNIVAGVQTKK